MSATLPYIRTQKQILDDLEALIRDTANGRFTELEIYLAVNQGLTRWADKVKVLYLYNLPGSYAAGTKEYTLPAYIRPPIFPEVHLPSPYYEHAIESYSYEWRDLVGWDMQPNGAGANVLTVYNPRSEAGRVWFYAPNSRVPTTNPLPTTSGSTSDTATSMTLGSAVDIDDVGTVKVGAEYLSYAGVTRNAATTVLNNLVRGLYGSSPATHDSASTVTWCVAADRLSLYDQLHNQARAVLAAMPQFNASTHERAIYQQLLQYFQQQADAYWQTYSQPRRQAPVRLNRATFAFK